MTRTQRRVIVVGAGLAGLAAAIAAAEQGAHVEVLERQDAPGGATRDSAGWIWRYRDQRTARTTIAPTPDVIPTSPKMSAQAESPVTVAGFVSTHAQPPSTSPSTMPATASTTSHTRPGFSFSMPPC